MTMRNRQILVAVGLVILAIWVVMTWVGSTASPEPSGGPSPTGAIGSGPFTFGPSDGVASASPSGATATAGASGGSSPALTGNPVSTPAPGATATPAQAVRWSGTWANTSPDNSTGSLEIVWTQDGSGLQGTLTMSGVACFTAGGIEGTVDGNQVTFQVLLRDEVEFEGTIAGDRVSGTFSLSCDGSEGTWEATRQP
jgi:hypothetical protein